MCDFGAMYCGREEMLHGNMINYGAGKRAHPVGTEPPRQNATDAVEHPDFFR